MTVNLGLAFTASGAPGTGLLTGEYNNDPTGGGGRIHTAGWGRSATMVPVIGTRKRSQLVDNLGGVDVVLSADQQARLDDVSRADLGFPYDFVPDGRSGFMGPITEQVDDHHRTVV